jgi:hypothetical protein
MNKQQTIDFLNSILKERFNDIKSFKTVKVNEAKITNYINAFYKSTKYGDIFVSVLTYDKNTDTDNYIRIVIFNNSTFQF